MPIVINYHDYKNSERKRSRANLTAEFGTNWVYIGRWNGTYNFKEGALANPYTINKRSVTSSRGKVTLSKDPCGDFAKHLNQKLDERDPVFVRAMQAINEQTALVCWCGAGNCHGDEVAKIWRKRHDEIMALKFRQPLHAITIAEPWCSFIFKMLPEGHEWPEWLPAKNPENRSRPHQFKRFIGKTIAMHAGKTKNREHFPAGIDSFCVMTGMELPDDFKEWNGGNILGLAVLKEVVSAETIEKRAEAGDIEATDMVRWVADDWCLVFENVTRIKPVPCGGALYPWKVQGELLETVRANAKAVSYCTRG